MEVTIKSSVDTAVKNRTSLFFFHGYSLLIFIIGATEKVVNINLQIFSKSIKIINARIGTLFNPFIDISTREW